MKYSEILQKNQKFKKTKFKKKIKIALISNSTIVQLKEIVELQLKEESINAEVTLGGYNTIIEDSKRFSKYNAIIIFWDSFNFIEEFNNKIYNLNLKDLNSIKEKIKKDIDQVIKNTKDTSLVIFNKFSSMPFENEFISENLLYNFCNDLNKHLYLKQPKNWAVVDLEKLFGRLGIKESFNVQQFYFSKSLYSINFFKSYSKYIKSIFLNLTGKSKKVIILDCDNTLWGGILGEDGEKNLKIQPNSFEGRIFNEAQEILKYYSRNGILLAICSKNNFQDVNNFIKRKSMPLKIKDFVAIKANWQNKVQNIKEISRELNLGTDSFIFVDDSQFEIDFVKKNLPNIKCIKVPNNLSDYPKKIKEISELIFNFSKTKEDKNKTEMYKIEIKRQESKKESNSLDNYLKSLELSMKINWGNKVDTARASQMCQKTNQFNLTTKRYSEGDIDRFKRRKDILIVDFSLKDKFGDYGITGLSIIKIKKKKEAYVDLFLMSCRVIGRNAENFFLKNIIKKLIKKNFSKLGAKYAQTKKNIIVNEFYEKNDFNLLKKQGKNKLYNLYIKDFTLQNKDFIKLSK